MGLAGSRGRDACLGLVCKWTWCVVLVTPEHDVGICQAGGTEGLRGTVFCRVVGLNPHLLQQDRIFSPLYPNGSNLLHYSL